MESLSITHTADNSSAATEGKSALLWTRSSKTKGANGCRGLVCYEMQLSLLARLLHSLAAVHTKVPIHTIVDVQTPAITKVLVRLGTKLLPLPGGAPTPHGQPYHAPTFGKLRLLKLVHFKRILFFDNDIIVRQNVDQLLLHGPAPAVVFQVLAQGLNSGVMLLRPDRGTL